MRIRATWIAGAALLAALPVAHAQSSVTISGNLDVGVQQYKQANGVSVNRLQSNAWTASNLQFAGTEDLGGGLRANFVLDMNPSVDTGTLSKFGAFNRASYVGLSDTSWGEFRAGKQLTPSANLVCQVDLQWCSSGWLGSGILYNGDLTAVGRWVSGSPGRGGNANDGISVYSGGDKTAGSADSNRKNNSVEYISPRMAGFQVKGLYALGEAGSGAANGSGNHGDVTLAYGTGNLWVALGHAHVEPDPAWDAKGSLTTLGATYRLVPQLTVGAAIQQETASGSAAKWTRASAWAVTAVYQVGAFAPYLKFGEHRTNGTGAYGIVDAIDTQVVNVGTTYNLSKRTQLYADFVTDLKGSNGNPAIYRNDPHAISLGINLMF